MDNNEDMSENAIGKVKPIIIACGLNITHFACNFSAEKLWR